MDREPSASGFTIVSQEGDGTILLVVLYCKPNGRVNTVYVLEEALFVSFLVDDKGGHPHTCPRTLGGGGQYLELFVLCTPCISWLQWTDWGTHGSTLNLFIELALEREVCVLRQNSKRRIKSSTSITVLSLRVLSFTNRSLIMLRAGSMGTEVNGADTS